MTERAKLWKPIVAVLTATAGLGCMTTETGKPRPLYDQRTRQLVRLDWDANGDGRTEHRTYFVDGIAVRSEVDDNRDGIVDRWEYVDRAAAVTHIGTSSANDGLEDTWTWTTGADGETRIQRAQYRDGSIDRVEVVRENALVRAEEDANRDGVTDKWETWSAGVLREAAYDTSFTRGRPDRRLVYQDGRFVHLESDSDGDGQFERLASNQPGIRREDP